MAALIFTLAACTPIVDNPKLEVFTPKSTDGSNPNNIGVRISAEHIKDQNYTDDQRFEDMHAAKSKLVAAGYPVRAVLSFVPRDQSGQQQARRPYLGLWIGEERVRPSALTSKDLNAMLDARDANLISTIAKLMGKEVPVAEKVEAKADEATDTKGKPDF